MGVQRALFDGIIDYAGLFPPAALSMDRAVAEFGEISRSEDAWLVRRFVCPIGWLGDLSAELPATVDGSWRLSVLGTSLEGSKQDLVALEKFEAELGDRALVDAYEVRAGDQPARNDLQHIANFGFEEAYIELAWTQDWKSALHELAEHECLFAKARTGGLEATAFPGSRLVAEWIRECVSLDLPFKFTAGLHHPLPHFDRAIGVRHHGFLNVLMATGLAVAHDLNVGEICQVLDCESRDDFWFSAKGAGFKDWELSMEEITEARGLFMSFGSCSVAEPVEGMVDLGLMESVR